MIARVGSLAWLSVAVFTAVAAYVDNSKRFFVDIVAAIWTMTTSLYDTNRLVPILVARSMSCCSFPIDTFRLHAPFAVTL